MAVNPRATVARLNTACRTALEAAAGLCLSRSHHDVEIEHFLLKLAEVDNSDIRRILRQFERPPEALERALEKTLDGLKTGNTRTPSLSPHLPELLERAWVVGSLELGESRIRSGHVLLALASDPDLKRLLSRQVQEAMAVNVETLQESFHAIVDGSAEAREARLLGDAGAGAASAGGDGAPTGKPSAAPNLDKYCVNLTQRAREGALDPVLGRDAEIRQMIDILTRRRQNSPILTGEAGVGKTAVVEGLAGRIVEGAVPPILQNVELLALDLGLLQAGASVKGEFEARLKGVLDEVKASPRPIIMFIDEAHTLIGAGGAAGQNDAANLLKPALARGELRTVAATTWSEYKKYFEKDPALTRRFQVVKIEEPEETRALAMLRGMAAAMAAHHRVLILDEAISEAVKLSSRYIAGRQLPDKAVSVLDTACAKIAISQNAVPAEIQDARQQRAVLATERGLLQGESSAGSDHDERLAAIDAEDADLAARLEQLEARWERERALVGQLHEQLAALAGTDGDAGGTEPAEGGDGEVAAAQAGDGDARERIRALRAELAQVQGHEPMVNALVDGNAVAQIVASWTGIPVGKMVSDEIQTVLRLRELLEARVIGQSHALDAIAQRVRTSRANLEDPNKPKGVFLLVGTSGVGKTETAIALAETLYGGERNMITINMSEYQEAHTVSSLKGSPPGYVGYGEGGVLTEAVRRRPYSVVLLDEVEKAHPDVLELFFQVFDKGKMEDGEGREIDFKNTLILLTSNAGTDLVMQACRTGDPDAAELDALLRPELNRVFKPAFIGRTTVIPYFPLRDEELQKIVRLKLDKIGRRIAANHGAGFEYSPELIAAVAARCTEVDSGARAIDNILTGTLLPEVAGEVLARMSEGARVAMIRAGLDGEGRFAYSID